MKTKVVHVSKSRYDVYIGRGPDPNTGIDGKWGNPFLIGRDGTRSEVIAKYRTWIVNQPELMASLKELQGKTLGCWCKPLACHGSVLAELADHDDCTENKSDESGIFGRED